MEQNLNYFHLHAFDEEKMKAGGQICSRMGVNLTHIAGPDSNGRLAVWLGDHLTLTDTGDVRMRPLCWVENEPVYEGSHLWYKGDCSDLLHEILVTQMNPRDGGKGIEGVVQSCNLAGYTQKGALTWAPVGSWTWKKPEVKREGWINIYPNPDVSTCRYDTEDIAKFNAGPDCIRTIHIEW